MKYRSSLTSRMGLGGLAAVAAAAVVLAACGSTTPASAPPQQAVNTAFRNLGSQSGVTLRVSLGVTGKQLQQIEAGDGSHALTSTAANDIAATSVVVDLNQTSSGRNGQFGLAVHVGPTPQ